MRIYKVTKRHLNWEELKCENWDVELGHLSAFTWAVLFSCPVLARLFAFVQQAVPSQNNNIILTWDSGREARKCD